MKAGTTTAFSIFKHFRLHGPAQHDEAGVRSHRCQNENLKRYSNLLGIVQLQPACHVAILRNLHMHRGEPRGSNMPRGTGVQSRLPLAINTWK